MIETELGQTSDLLSDFGVDAFGSVAPPFRRATFTVNSISKSLLYLTSDAASSSFLPSCISYSL